MPQLIISEVCVKVFISYAHADQDLRKRVEDHLTALKLLGKITIWQDQEIPPGANWKDVINTRINEADLILLLVSANFLASNYCWNKEVGIALERHKAGTARVVPLIIQPVHWEDTPLGQLQALPTAARPVTLWPNEEDALASIARGIRDVVEDLQRKWREDAVNNGSVDSNRTIILDSQDEPPPPSPIELPPPISRPKKKNASLRQTLLSSLKYLRRTWHRYLLLIGFALIGGRALRLAVPDQKTALPNLVPIALKNPLTGMNIAIDLPSLIFIACFLFGLLFVFVMVMIGSHENPADPDLEMEIDPDLEIDVDPDLEMEIDPDLDIDVDPDLDVDVDPDLDVDVDPDLDVDVDPDLDVDVDPDLDVDAGTGTNAANNETTSVPDTRTAEPIGQGNKGHIPETTPNTIKSVLRLVSPMNIALLSLWFGFVGFAIKNTTQFGLPATVELAFFSAVILAAIILALIKRILAKASGSTKLDVYDPAGLLAKVSDSIPENGVGEIYYVSASHSRGRRPARSVDGRGIERGLEVKVVKTLNGIALVTTRNHSTKKYSPML